LYIQALWERLQPRRTSIGLLFAAMFAIVASAVHAADVPQLAAPITDLTGTLSEADRKSLEPDLIALEKRKGSQLVVLMVPTTAPDTIEAFALAVAEKNRIGRGEGDDGVLLLIARDDRKARIEVGYGLEGAIPDAIAARIIREYLGPRFRAGDYAGGIRDAVGALVKLIDGESLPAPVVAAHDDRESRWFPALVLAFVIGSVLAATRMRPVLRRSGFAGALAAIAGLVIVGSLAGLLATGALAAIVALVQGGNGRYVSGRHGSGGWGGGARGGGGGWGGGGGSSGGWSGGGGSFGGGGASGGW
jgi:uncharacterized protein